MVDGPVTPAWVFTLDFGNFPGSRPQLNLYTPTSLGQLTSVVQSPMLHVAK